MFIKHQVIGHRGACAYAPENTLASFNKAYSLGCRFVEFDVMLSADGVPFVFHDETLQRTTNGIGKFSQAQAEYLKQLDAGSWFSNDFYNEKIPTLTETLNWLIEYQVQANIEIKSSLELSRATTKTTILQIKSYWPATRSYPLMSSFNLESLRECKQFAPEFPRGLLLSSWRSDWFKLAQSLECFSVHLSVRDATPARIQEIKNHGFAVCIYTVNHQDKAMRLFDWGVDAVFSDYPDILLTPP